MTLYERIREQRKKAGLSQPELANKLGYKDRSTISKIENGETDLAESKIKAIAAALDVSPYYLQYGWTEPRLESKEKPATGQGDGLSEAKQKLIDFIKTLDDSDVEKIHALADIALKG